MNADALPYTLLLILAELSIGSLWITLGSDLRGGVTRGFVMTMAMCVAIAAGLAYWTASGIAIGTEVDGYSIDPGPFDDMKRALVVVIVTSAIYMFCVFMGWDPIGRLFGIAGSIAGALAIVLLAMMLSPPPGASPPACWRSLEARWRSAPSPSPWSGGTGTSPKARSPPGPSATSTSFCSPPSSSRLLSSP